ncbi:hypothetical protein HK098_007091 [Nowakowskiella sp. JEL0407]|nr:hypothetical protein HK098_007091 [Nowakowskiella sp. JEL0407]
MGTFASKISDAYYSAGLKPVKRSATTGTTTSKKTTTTESSTTIVNPVTVTREASTAASTSSGSVKNAISEFRSIIINTDAAKNWSPDKDTSVDALIYKSKDINATPTSFVVEKIKINPDVAKNWNPDADESVEAIIYKSGPENSGPVDMPPTTELKSAAKKDDTPVENVAEPRIPSVEENAVKG